MSKVFTEAELEAEWSRLCFLVGMHGGFNEGRQVGIVMRFLSYPDISEMD